MDPSSANYPKDNQIKIKELGGRWPRKRASKRSHSEDRKEPFKTLNRTNNIVQELRDKWPNGRKQTL